METERNALSVKDLKEIYVRDEAFRREYNEWLDSHQEYDDYDNRRLHAFPYMEV